MKNISYIELNFIYNVLKCSGLHDYMKKNIEKWLIKKKYLMLTPKKILLTIIFTKCNRLFIVLSNAKNRFLKYLTVFEL